MRPNAKVGVMVMALIMGLGVVVGVEAGSTDPAPGADCDESPGQCTSCPEALSACEDALAASGKLPATGQGIGSPPIAGEDGNPAYGAALDYTADPAVGTALTVTDENTGLECEVKTTAVSSGANAADLHDVDNTYPWRGSCSIGGAECGTDIDCGGGGSVCDAGDGQTASPNGLTIFEWVAALNAASYAGHDDWRVPNVRELQSIVDYGRASPSIDPIFAPTVSSGYWSSTVYENAPTNAWGVVFVDGFVFAVGKSNFGLFARAVRGGS